MSGVGPGGHGDQTRGCFSTLLFVHLSPPGYRRRSGKREAHEVVGKGYESEAAKVDYMGKFALFNPIQKIRMHILETWHFSLDWTLHTSYLEWH